MKESKPLSTGQTAGLILVAITSLELVKFVIEKTLPTPVLLGDPQAGQLHELYNLHMKFDADGIPLWYIPRRWDVSQSKQTDILQTMAENQRRSLEILAKIHENQEKSK